jgi:hypothetical protein
VGTKSRSHECWFVNSHPDTASRFPFLDQSPGSQPPWMERRLLDHGQRRSAALQKDNTMPNERTIEKAREDKRRGKSPSTQAGEFVHDEIMNIRKGRHGARSAKQAIAIGLSMARRAGVDLSPPPKGSTSAGTRRKAAHDRAVGQGTRAGHAPSPKRARATIKALKRESTSAASHAALSRQASSAASHRSAASRSAAARKAARTKGAAGRRRAARKAARTRARD